MQPQDIRQLIEDHLPECEVHAQGGNGKYEVLVIGECFDGLNAVKRQQMVYGAINQQIADGTVHAVTIKALTPRQWQEQN